MKVKITVTEQDINEGCDSFDNPWSCPIARAAGRVLKESSFSITPQNLCWRNAAMRSYYYVPPVELPETAKEFQREGFRSRSSELPKPFSFTVDVPEEFVKRA